MTTGLYQSEKWLRQKFLREKKTAQEIAAMCKTSDVTIYKWIRKHGLK